MGLTHLGSCSQLLGSDGEGLPGNGRDRCLGSDVLGAGFVTLRARSWTLRAATRDGHGVAVLLKVYAHCIGGQADAAN